MPIDLNKTQEIFGFMMAQKFAQNAPKRTGLMSKSFPSTVKVEAEKITFTLPYYTKFVVEGTVKQRPNFFIQDTIHREAFKTLVEALKASNT